MNANTPKQQVVARYPKAYSLMYEHVACIYMEPVKAAPRGQVSNVVLLGTAKSVRGAWLDAAARLPARSKTPNAKLNGP